MNILAGCQLSELSEESRDVFTEDIIERLNLISRELIWDQKQGNRR